MISATGSNPFEEFGLRTPEQGSRGKGSDELGQEEFLSLMNAQFQNQDPFEPMENGEFLGQLAQFGTVSGVDELQQSFGQLAGAMQSSQALQAASLVGRSVLAETDQVRFTGDQPVAGAVQLDSAASDIVVEVQDVNGQQVRQMHLGTQNEGLARFEWDGLDNDGNPVAVGDYRIRADVVRGGNTEAGNLLTNQDVESVTVDPGGRGVSLNTPAGGLNLDAVREFL